MSAILRNITGRRVWFAAGWGLVAAVVYLSLAPAPAALAHVGDKAGHFAAYATITFWFSKPFAQLAARGPLILAFAGLGIGLECAQLGVPGRVFELADLAVNFAGIAAGHLVAILIVLEARRRRLAPAVIAD